MLLDSLDNTLMQLYLLISDKFLVYGDTCRSYALTPVYEESASVSAMKVDSDEPSSKEVILPGVNLLFDGSELHPFDISACLQARQPISLIAEASAACAAYAAR